MAASTLAPPEPPAVREKSAPLDEPQPLGPKESPRSLLAEIFQGHEEFLGWTPD